MSARHGPSALLDGRRLGTWLRHGLGLPGLAGLGSLALAATLLLRAGAPGPASPAAAPVAAVAAPSAARALADDPAPARAAALLASLPPATQGNADLARLVAWADAQGLAIERAETRRADGGGLPLVRIDLQLHLTADYEATRRWLVAALNHLPHAALRSLRFEREEAADRPLATQLTLRLHYRADTPAGAAR